jgi:hypothetical protein
VKLPGQVDQAPVSGAGLRAKGSPVTPSSSACTIQPITAACETSAGTFGGGGTVSGNNLFRPEVIRDVVATSWLTERAASRKVWRD